MLAKPNQPDLPLHRNYCVKCGFMCLEARLQKEQRSAVNREVVLSPGCLEDTQMELSSRGEL